MVSSSGRAAKQRLREAIDAYCAELGNKLGNRARQLLVRLADSSDVAEIFERLKLEDRRSRVFLLAACVEAADIARTFSQRVAKQKHLLARAKRWEEAIAALRTFVAVATQQQDTLRVGLAGLDIWSLSIFSPPAGKAELKRAIDLIALSIDWQRGIAEANIAHLGATRDAYIKQAAENASIWILAAGVYDAARKPPLRGAPHHRDVADLAEVILGTEVTQERVREVLRKRRKLYLKLIADQTQRHLHSPRPFRLMRPNGRSGALPAD